MILVDPNATPLSPWAQMAMDSLRKWRLLLLQDPSLPSLAVLIAGEPIKGSWWGHPKGTAIFTAAGELAEHPDVISTKLVGGKVTFAHRQIFPALITIGRARESWQTAGLSKGAQQLLTRVDRNKLVQASGKFAKELEKNLLVASQQVHTESGAHAIELTTWESFAKESKVPLRKRSVARARSELEALLTSMTAASGSRAKLPWQ